MDEGLVAGEEAVTAGQQVAFEPAFALMLAQHLHHPAIGSDMLVTRDHLCDGTAIRHLEHRVPAVG
jgi:hypothetical protein